MEPRLVKLESELILIWVALILPELTTGAPTAAISTTPLWLCKELAWMTPLLLTALSKIPLSTLAFKKTLPPSAWIIPVFSMALAIFWPSGPKTP